MAELETYLKHFKNYYIYSNTIKERKPGMVVYVPRDISVDNIDDHINGISSILKDGIDEEYIHNMLITVSWGDGKECELFIVDYWFSLFMWSMILKNGDKIEPKHVFWAPELKRKDIKRFVDDYVLTKVNKIRLGNEYLNNNVCDGLWYYSMIEPFSYYLANTINNEDNIALMKAVPEFYDILHCSMEGVPFDQVKSVGMEANNRAISIIKDSYEYLGYEHGLVNSFRVNEAVNPRQHKEVAVNIGTKPNGTGGIYPHVINKSFLMGGVNDPLSYFIESSSARTAQILSKTNVGDSGDFARLLGLNNTDTILKKDMYYECMSQHYIKYEIKTEKHLFMIKNRYYRFNPRGMEYLIDDKDKSLIGKTIYLHSPMTCASHSSGHGICKRCYGDLYYTNININAGKIAAELLSAQLTQTLLSAKHLLETRIVSINWNPEFSDFFDIDINSIKLTDMDDDVNLKKYIMIIDPDDVNLVNDEEETISYDEEGNEVIIEDDTGVYNEYITHFYIKTPDGEMIEFCSEHKEPLYISQELNRIIRKKAFASDEQVNIPLTALQDSILFYRLIIMKFQRQ